MQYDCLLTRRTKMAAGTRATRCVNDLKKSHISIFPATSFYFFSWYLSCSINASTLWRIYHNIANIYRSSKFLPIPNTKWDIVHQHLFLLSSPLMVMFKACSIRTAWSSYYLIKYFPQSHSFSLDLSKSILHTFDDHLDHEKLLRARESILLLNFQLNQFWNFMPRAPPC